MPFAFIAEINSASPPQAFGELILVPFISCFNCVLDCGTEVTAPPGALMQTPRSPSAVGPRDDHVYCAPSPWIGCLTECPVLANDGATNALENGQRAKAHGSASL